MNEFMLLLIGESESGKSLIANYISEKYGIPILESYTTRPRRKRETSGHIFVTYDVYKETPKENIIAETCFGGHYYYATKDQVKSRIIYIVDEAGYLMLKNKYPIYSVRVIRRFRPQNDRTSRDNFNINPYEFDYILPNNSTIENLYEEIDLMMEKIL